MDFVYIERKLWKILRDHARSESPNECIGYFAGKPEGAGNFRITDVYPCKNVSRHKKESGDISKSELRKLKNLMRKNERVYGMYHSHPNTGTTYLSTKDSFIGKVYKRFRHQLITGVYGKSKKIRMAFWFYKKPLWQEVEILVKREPTC